MSQLTPSVALIVAETLSGKNICWSLEITAWDEFPKFSVVYVPLLSTVHILRLWWVSSTEQT
jgi:hypothetical protein